MANVWLFSVAAVLALGLGACGSKPATSGAASGPAGESPGTAPAPAAAENEAVTDDDGASGDTGEGGESSEGNEGVEGTGTTDGTEGAEGKPVPPPAEGAEGTPVATEGVEGSPVVPPPDNPPPDEEPPPPEPASQEPVKIRPPAAVVPRPIFEAATELELPIGEGDGHAGVIPGAEDELPRGPESFDIDSDGSVVLLDNQNRALKSFAFGGALTNRCDLGEDGNAFVDVSLSPAGEAALAHASTERVLVVPKTARDLLQVTRVNLLPELRGFNGIAFNQDGGLFSRAGSQLTFQLSDKLPDRPILALLSRFKKRFFRTRVLSQQMGVLYASDTEQAAAFMGNAQKQYEVSLGKPILSMSYLDADAQGRVYLHIETDEGGADDAVHVKRYVVRIGDAESDWSEPMEVPTDVYAMPFRDLRVTADGTVYAMSVYPDHVKVTRWTAK